MPKNKSPVENRIWIISQNKLNFWLNLYLLKFDIAGKSNKNRLIPWTTRFLIDIVTSYKNSRIFLFVSESSEDEHAVDHLHVVPHDDENTAHHRVARSLPYYLSTKPPVSLSGHQTK